MRPIYRSLAALPFVACAVNDADLAAPRLDARADESVIVDGAFDRAMGKDIAARDIAIAEVLVEDGPRRETGPLCPVHADACPPDCAPFRGYRVHRLRGCFDPVQVISCVDPATESTIGQFCVVRVDDELFRTEEMRPALDPAAWRQCGMEEADYARAWQAIPCDEDAPSWLGAVSLPILPPPPAPAVGSPLTK